MISHSSAAAEDSRHSVLLPLVRSHSLVGGALNGNLNAKHNGIEICMLNFLHRHHHLPSPPLGFSFFKNWLSNELSGLNARASCIMHVHIRRFFLCRASSGFGIPCRAHTFVCLELSKHKHFNHAARRFRSRLLCLSFAVRRQWDVNGRRQD